MSIGFVLVEMVNGCPEPSLLSRLVWLFNCRGSYRGEAVKPLSVLNSALWVSSEFHLEFYEGMFLSAMFTIVTLCNLSVKSYLDIRVTCNV